MDAAASVTSDPCGAKANGQHSVDTPCDLCRWHWGLPPPVALMSRMTICSPHCTHRASQGLFTSSSPCGAQTFSHRGALGRGAWTLSSSRGISSDLGVKYHLSTDGSHPRLVCPVAYPVVPGRCLMDSSSSSPIPLLPCPSRPVHSSRYRVPPAVAQPLLSP